MYHEGKDEIRDRSDESKLEEEGSGLAVEVVYA